VTAPDRSLSTLWVDPSYRSRSLGKLVARQRLISSNGMLEQASRGIQGCGYEKDLSEPGKAENATLKWSHADIAQNNTGSRRICEWLGGKSRWMVFWARVRIVRRDDGVLRYESLGK
jgi:hypothetical protein